MKRLLEVGAVALMVLNMLGGVVAGIWLAIIGSWGAIGWGLVFAFGGSFIISIALMPSLLLVAPIIGFTKKGWGAGALAFGALNMLYTFAVMTAWCAGMYIFFASRIGEDAGLPYLLWAYGAATAPIAHMASKDNNENSVLTALIAQVAFVLAIISGLLTSSHVVALLVLACMMLAGLGLQLFIAYATWRSEKDLQAFIARHG
ncbi:hypothetical protein [Lysobacter sp. FW306-1B-D06B]|uniref:hypothetical protein n=1 Tax=Lysobacter sp. FW306-1B-D06B TaxID=3140250 RepID=UPI003140224A